MTYSITREDPERDLRALRSVLSGFPASISSSAIPALQELADSIEEQVKPAVEEPTGDVVAFVLGAPYWPREGGVHWVTYNHNNNPPTWGELIDGLNPDAIQIYRRSDADEPHQSAAWRHGYEQATKNTRERIYNRVTAVKADLITAPEQTAIDKALAAIEKDADDTVTGRGFPS